MALVGGVGLGCGAAATPAEQTVPTASRVRAASTLPPPALRVAMDDVQERLSQVGLQPWDAVQSNGFISDGGRFVHPVELPAERCITLVALATRGVGDMDAALYSADGDMLAADAQPDSHPAIQVCGGDAAAQLYYVVHAYEGAGSFLMRAFEGPRAAFAGTAIELGGSPAIALTPRVAPSVQDEMDTVALGLSRRGFSPLRLPRRMVLDAGQRVRQGIQVEAGQCYTAAAFAFRGLSKVALRVFDEQGAEIASGGGERPVAQVQFCALKATHFSTETFAASGEGQVAMLLYHGNAHRVLTGPGLWLGRLRPTRQANAAKLGAFAKTHLPEAASIDNLREVGSGSLAPGQAVEHQLRIPAGGCYGLRVVADATLPEVLLSVRNTQGRYEPLPNGLVCESVPRPVVVRLVARGGYGAYSLAIRSGRALRKRPGAGGR